ncbi:MAG TPA: glycosyltransferase [Parafilimonas sp.]|nr:glycosyltransferase [Parafilimonas sp.]
MTVSICCITYNHAAYIKQAVESFVMQQCRFDYEIIISDDCSKDGTRKILAELKEQYSEKIKLLLNEKNIGMMPNFIQALKACRGKYIALCEGDDYWTDSNKLQKQVDFLEAHASYSLCFHNCTVRNERVHPATESLLIKDLNKTTFETEDLLKQWFIPTASIVFRNNGFAFPDWFYYVESGDIALLLLLSLQGAFKYLDEVMSVYCMHPLGVSTQHVRYKKAIGMTYLYQSFNIYTNYKYNDKISNAIKYEWYMHVINKLVQENEAALLQSFTKQSIPRQVFFFVERKIKNLKHKLTQNLPAFSHK